MMFRIPTITKNLLIINILIYIAQFIMFPQRPDLSAVANWGKLHFFLASDFHLYQFVSYLFLHADFMHLLSNMFGLWMFGCVIENVWGPKKFLFYYITCGIGAGFCQELVQYIQYISDSYLAAMPLETIIQVNNNGSIVERTIAESLNSWGTIGASGAIYAIILAFGMTFPNERLFIIPIPFPIKAKWFVLGYAAIEFYMSIQTTGDGIAHTAHLGGMLFGFLMIRYWNRHPNSGYDRGRGMQFFDNLKRNFEQRQHQQGSRYHNPNMHVNQGGGSKEADMEYNARKRQNQAEIDAILDKIRKSGYDSLTKEEKKKLFDASNQS